MEGTYAAPSRGELAAEYLGRACGGVSLPPPGGASANVEASFSNSVLRELLDGELTQDDLDALVGFASCAADLGRLNRIAADNRTPTWDEVKGACRCDRRCGLALFCDPESAVWRHWAAVRDADAKAKATARAEARGQEGGRAHGESKGFASHMGMGLDGKKAGGAGKFPFPARAFHAILLFCSRGG